MVRLTHYAHRLAGSLRQQNWCFAGYSTAGEIETASAHSAAAAAAAASLEEPVCDELAGRNVEVKWEGNDQW